MCTFALKYFIVLKCHKQNTKQEIAFPYVNFNLFFKIGEYKYRSVRSY